MCLTAGSIEWLWFNPRCLSSTAKGIFLMSNCPEIFLLHQFFVYKYETTLCMGNTTSQYIHTIYCHPKTSLATHEWVARLVLTTVIKTEDVVLLLVKVSDESVGPELERDHKTPSLIILFQKKSVQSNILLGDPYFLVSLQRYVLQLRWFVQKNPAHFKKHLASCRNIFRFLPFIFFSVRHVRASVPGRICQLLLTARTCRKLLVSAWWVPPVHEEVCVGEISSLP